MANAGKHGMHPGAQGKGSGAGAMTDLPEGVLGENDVLSNRDKAQHGDARGLDSKMAQTEQYQDHSAHRTGSGEGSDPTEGNASGLSNPMTNTSGDDGSLVRKRGEQEDAPVPPRSGRETPGSQKGRATPALHVLGRSRI